MRSDARATRGGQVASVFMTTSSTAAGGSTHLGGDRVVVWSPDYLDYRWGPSHPMNPTRLDLTMALTRSIGLLEGVETVRPDLRATQIYSAFIPPGTSMQSRRQVRRPPGRSLRPIHRTVSVPKTIRSSRKCMRRAPHWRGHVGRCPRDRIRQNPQGGEHRWWHAPRDGGLGRRLLRLQRRSDRHLVVARSGYDRIAYVDVDAHHGDGVQHAFLDDPRVLTVSIHQHPATLWPNTGWSSEVGAGAAEGTAINLPVLPGTVDSLWLRAFHAVVPGAIAAFRPQILISQCGADSHREDPLADLSLTVDGQRASYLVMRDLADRYCEGRWLALGGGGYGLVRVVPRSWTHLIAAALDREIDLTTKVPDDWRERVGAMAPGVELPTEMGEGADLSYLPWDGPGGTPETGVASLDRALTRIDSAIIATRRASFPLLGLDPEDPRD